VAFSLADTNKDGALTQDEAARAAAQIGRGLGIQEPARR
jgi:hypothetical protein